MAAFQKKFSFVLSIAITSFTSVSFFALLYLQGRASFPTDFLIFLLLNFIIIYFLLAFANTNFIFERLSQILESIVHHRNHKTSPKYLPAGNDVIEDIREEIAGW